MMIGFWKENGKFIEWLGLALVSSGLLFILIHTIFREPIRLTNRSDWQPDQWSAQNFSWQRYEQTGVMRYSFQAKYIYNTDENWTAEYGMLSSQKKPGWILSAKHWYSKDTNHADKASIYVQQKVHFIYQKADEPWTIDTDEAWLLLKQSIIWGNQPMVAQSSRQMVASDHWKGDLHKGNWSFQGRVRTKMLV